MLVFFSAGYTGEENYEQKKCGIYNFAIYKMCPSCALQNVCVITILRRACVWAVLMGSGIFFCLGFMGRGGRLSTKVGHTTLVENS